MKKAKNFTWKQRPGFGLSKAIIFSVVDVCKEERGIALFTVSMAFVFLFTVGVGFLSVVSIEKMIALHQKNSTQAFYLAQAGVEKSLYYLRNDARWREGFTDVYLGEGRIVQVKVEDMEEDKVKIIAEGEVKNSRQTIEAVLESFLLPAYYCSLFAASSDSTTRITSSISGISGRVIHGGDLIINPHVEVGFYEVEGEVWVGGTLEVSKHAEVYGNVYAKKVINDGNIHGEITLIDDLGDLSLYPPTSLVEYKDRADYTYSGKQILYLNELNNLLEKEAFLPTLIYVEGDVSIRRKNNDLPYQGQLVIVASQNLEVKTDVLPETDEDGWVFISGGDMDLGNYKLGGIFRADGTLISGGNPEIIGSIIASNIESRGNLVVQYEEKFIEQHKEFLFPYRWKILSWKEM